MEKVNRSHIIILLIYVLLLLINYTDYLNTTIKINQIVKPIINMPTFVFLYFGSKI